jgi:hypothetical protein
MPAADDIAYDYGPIFGILNEIWRNSRPHANITHHFRLR